MPYSSEDLIYLDSWYLNVVNIGSFKQSSEIKDVIFLNHEYLIVNFEAVIRLIRLVAVWCTSFAYNTFVHIHSQNHQCKGCKYMYIANFF